MSEAPLCRRRSVREGGMGRNAAAGGPHSKLHLQTSCSICTYMRVSPAPYLDCTLLSTSRPDFRLISHSSDLTSISSSLYTVSPPPTAQLTTASRYHTELSSSAPTRFCRRRRMGAETPAWRGATLGWTTRSSEGRSCLRYSAALSGLMVSTSF